MLRSNTKGMRLQDIVRTIEEYFEPRKEIEPEIIEEDQQDDPNSDFLVSDLSWDVSDDEDDFVLQVDRSISRRNIKDVRARVNKKSLRHGIIVSEILNKPKSLRKTKD